MAIKLALFSLLAAFVSSAAVKRGYTGKATFYTWRDSDPNWLCGGVYTDDYVKIVALRYPGLINDGNKDQYCGRTINVNYQGKSVDAVVVDGCASCNEDSWIDLSPGAIMVLDSNYNDTGTLKGVTWSFADGSGGGNQNQQTSTAPLPTSTYTPPETSTWTPEPSPSLVETSSSTSSSQVPSSFSSSVASSSTMSSTSLNATATSISTSINSTSLMPNATALVNSSATALTVALPHTTTAIAPDAIVTTDDGSASGNLAALNNFVAYLGRIVVVGASL